jgi:predicted O-methyltransferase YrrM
MKCETYVLQNKTEINALIDLFRKENVRSYLEIGSKFGGSLWLIANALPLGSRIVSVDLPHGDTSFKENEEPLRQCVNEIKRRGYDCHLIIGDSTNASVIEKVSILGPYDAVFIDANHTTPYVTKDWQNYSGMGKIIAFHDIAFLREAGMDAGKKPIQVPQFWNEIKTKYRHVEIKHEPIRGNVGRRKCDNGIGVLWPS